MSRLQCLISKLHQANDAYDYVTKHVGANIPCRDIVDERIIEEVKTVFLIMIRNLRRMLMVILQACLLSQWERTVSLNIVVYPKILYKIGIITDIRQMGGFPEYKGTPYVDTDGDGMPDEWKLLMD